jgi:hypothetical protein
MANARQIAEVESLADMRALIKRLPTVLHIIKYNDNFEVEDRKAGSTSRR